MKKSSIYVREASVYVYTIDYEHNCKLDATVTVDATSLSEATAKAKRICGLPIIRINCLGKLNKAVPFLR